MSRQKYDSADFIVSQVASDPIIHFMIMNRLRRCFAAVSATPQMTIKHAGLKHRRDATGESIEACSRLSLTSVEAEIEMLLALIQQIGHTQSQIAFKKRDDRRRRLW